VIKLYTIDRFTAMMKKFPTLRTILCHLGVSRLWNFSQSDPYSQLPKTLDFLDKKRCLLSQTIGSVDKVNILMVYGRNCHRRKTERRNFDVKKI
jgi:hypothetical protein